jgi:hypothetical protein
MADYDRWDDEREAARRRREEERRFDGPRQRGGYDPTAAGYAAAVGGERPFVGREALLDQERRVGGPYTDYGRAFGGFGAGGGYTPTPGEGIGREPRSWDDRDAGHRGRGPKGYVRSDERIREDVSDRLTDDPIVDASDIEVLVQGGEVTLNGYVDSRTAKRRAEDCAESATGARHVQNNLRVRETPKPGTIGAANDPRVAAVSDGKDEAGAAKDAAR